jgi:hypothetical protein
MSPVQVPFSTNPTLICKRLRSPGIDSEESISPGWESIPGLLKRFTNTGSVVFSFVICKPFQKPMNRFRGIDFARLGIDSMALFQRFTNTGSVVFSPETLRNPMRTTEEPSMPAATVYLLYAGHVFTEMHCWSIKINLGRSRFCLHCMLYTSDVILLDCRTSN